jgi:alpha-tubulin suppressor-like RCC1 family protein
MTRIPIALPHWSSVACFSLVSVLGACSDDGAGPPDEPLDDHPAAFPLESLTVGSHHTCGLSSEGKAYCWGRNDNGQLDDGTTTNHSTPVPVAGDLSFRTLHAGGRHSCGINTDGATYCWGMNHVGQLGDGTTTDRPTPGRVAVGLGLVSLSVGGGYSCGLTAAGGAYCWGSSGTSAIGRRWCTAPAS